MKGISLRLALAAMACALATSAAAQPPDSYAEHAAINISTATTTELIARSTDGKLIEVPGGLVYAGGTGNITFKAGTGTTCGTGTRSLTGPIPLKDQGGFANLSLKTRPGEALCATTDAAVQISGYLNWRYR